MSRLRLQCKYVKPQQTAYQHILDTVPSVIAAARQLAHTQHRGLERVRSEIELLSRFNTQVRDYALRFPDASVNELLNGMQEIAAFPTPSHSLQGFIEYQLHAIVRGARHELAFRQIVEQSGRTIHHASTEDDLHGVDYIVQGRHRPLPVNVKASMEEIRGRHGEQTPYSIHKGTILVYSTVTDDDFGDSFFIPEIIAQQHAVTIDSYLHNAETELQHHRHYHHRRGNNTRRSVA